MQPDIPGSQRTVNELRVAAQLGQRQRCKQLLEQYYLQRLYPREHTWFLEWNRFAPTLANGAQRRYTARRNHLFDEFLDRVSGGSMVHFNGEFETLAGKWLMLWEDTKQETNRLRIEAIGLHTDAMMQNADGGAKA